MKTSVRVHHLGLIFTSGSSTSLAKKPALRATSTQPAIRTVRIAKMLLIMLSIVCSGKLSAQRSERTIFQFQHTGWTAKDGAPSPMWAIAQTTDGTLWMTAFDGLYRFDGIRFEPYPLPATLSSYVGDARALLATPDGGLWIGLNRGGAIFLKDG